MFRCTIKADHKKVSILQNQVGSTYECIDVGRWRLGVNVFTLNKDCPRIQQK